MNDHPSTARERLIAPLVRRIPGLAWTEIRATLSMARLSPLVCGLAAVLPFGSWLFFVRSDDDPQRTTGCLPASADL